MNCLACQAFASNRLSGAYQTGCTECDTRHLASGLLFWQSKKAGQITQAYRSALDKLFGSEWQSGHARVKRCAALHRGTV